MKLPRLLILLVVSLVFVCATAAVDDEECTVMELDTETVRTLLSTEGTALVVEFYANECPLCVEFADDFELLSKAITAKPSNIKLGRFEINKDNIKMIAKRLGITKLPTVMFFARGESHMYRRPSLAVDDLAQFIESCNEPVTVFNNATELRRFIALHNTSLIGFFNSITDQDYEEYQKFINALHCESSVAAFATAVSPSILSEVVPHAIATSAVTTGRVFTFHNGRVENPVEFDHSGHLNGMQLSSWIIADSLPLFAEITFETAESYLQTGNSVVWVVVNSSQPETAAHTEAAKQLMQKVAATYHRKLLFTFIDFAKAPQQAATVVPLPKGFPSIAFTTFEMKRFILEEHGGDITEEKLRQFIENAKNGRLEPFKLSEPPVENKEDADVFIAVGTTFRQMVIEDKSHDVFVLFTGCDTCDFHDKLFKETSTLLKGMSPSLRFVAINVFKNEIEVDSRIGKAMPAMALYNKDAKDKPIPFTEDMIMPNIVKFLKDKAKVPVDIRSKDEFDEATKREL